MKASEMREMSDGELFAALEDAKVELFNLRFQREAGALEDFNRLRIVRRNIARLKTVLRERQIAAELVRQEEEGNAE